MRCRIPGQVGIGEQVAVWWFQQGEVRGRHLALGAAAPARGGEARVQHAVAQPGQGVRADLRREGGGDGGGLVRGGRGRDNCQVLSAEWGGGSSEEKHTWIAQGTRYIFPQSLLFLGGRLLGKVVWLDERRGSTAFACSCHKVVQGIDIKKWLVHWSIRDFVPTNLDSSV